MREARLNKGCIKLSSGNLQLTVASFCSLFRRPFLLLNNGFTRRLAYMLLKRKGEYPDSIFDPSFSHLVRLNE